MLRVLYKNIKETAVSKLDFQSTKFHTHCGLERFAGTCIPVAGLAAHQHCCADGERCEPSVMHTREHKCRPPHPCHALVRLVPEGHAPAPISTTCECCGLQRALTSSSCRKSNAFRLPRVGLAYLARNSLWINLCLAASLLCACVVCVAGVIGSE